MTGKSITFFTVQVTEAQICFLSVQRYIFTDLTNENIAQDPPVTHGQVQTHESGDALGHTKLGHLHSAFIQNNCKKVNAVFPINL
jgi:hypothetical protein